MFIGSKWFGFENPVKLYGWFPTLFWTIYTAIGLSWFGLQEILGLRRVHGMIPFTWYIRCAGRAYLLALFIIAIWHFVWCTTKVK